MKSFHFYKYSSVWFFDLPTYICNGGCKNDLAIVKGADVLLNILAAGEDDLQIMISKEQIEGGYELVNEGPSVINSDFYRLKGKGTENQIIWLSDIAMLVFDMIPQKIFVKKL